VLEDLNMALLQIRVDEELKNQANAIYNELGIDLSTAVRMFLKKSVLEGGIPFETKVDQLTLNAILSVDKMRTISENNGNSELNLNKINEEIRKARKERKNKK
jgi:DNA-damage-inducible protein J